MLKLEFVDHSQTSFWIVDDAVSIGSSSKNQLVIPRDEVLPVHAHIMSQGGQIAIEPATPEARVSVNHSPIIARTLLQVTNIISIAGVQLRLIDPSVRQKPSLPTFTTQSETQVDEQILASDEAVVTQQWKVKAVIGVQKNKLIEVVDTVSVGRDTSNDIVINGGHISRRHAELSVKNDQLLVRDLDSSNGTSVNGEKIRERAVYLGDEIAFDSVAYRVVVGKASPHADSASVDKTQFRAAISLNDDLSHTAPALDVVQSHADLAAIQDLSEVQAAASQNDVHLNNLAERVMSDTELSQKNQRLIAFGIFFLMVLAAAAVLVV